jgi:hypothetical protein
VAGENSTIIFRIIPFQYVEESSDVLQTIDVDWRKKMLSVDFKHNSPVSSALY